ncbi:hypothetical protein GOV10_03610, partial [Candidatus Woesearchaeota archaeon]|nr:hypothetical protein [Candidatus Woesearchaeota archaeon]
MSSERVYGSQALAARLKISPRQARRLIQKLRDKGCLDRADAPRGGCPDIEDSPTRKLRLHAVQLKIGVLGGQVLKKRIIPDFMGCRIVVHPRMIEVYARKDIAFYGTDENDAQNLALDFFDRLGRKLQHDLNCLLIKSRAQNWELVKAEWATEGSEVARKSIEEGVKLEVFETESGRLWMWG